MKIKRILCFVLTTVLMLSFAVNAFAETQGERNALNSAKMYLSIMAFSQSGLIKQLEFEGYSTSEAQYAADNCGADWNEQAAKAARNYLSIMPFSDDGLIEQLEFEGYTHEQAVYGVNNYQGPESGIADQNLQALKSAKQYLSIMAFSYSGLIKQLEYEGYSTEEATYAADNCGADWFEQAAKAAKNYLSIMSFSRSGLIEQLMFEGYTRAQAEYGAKENGY
ncbi:MAG: Ltp family lipoprotein [Clostridia bacterium]|nr:Ltp family lipoprotein [Clostridia bacterium]